MKRSESEALRISLASRTCAGQDGTGLEDGTGREVWEESVAVGSGGRQGIDWPSPTTTELYPRPNSQVGGHIPRVGSADGSRYL